MAVPLQPSRQTQLWNAYGAYLPQLLGQTNQQTGSLAQQQLADTLGTQGGYNQLNLQQLLQYGLPLAQQGQQIQNSNALAGAGTNLAQLQGAGGNAAAYAQGLTNVLNPALSAANRGATSAIDAINLQGLSPGEFAATERAINQGNQGTGNLGLNNNTNTIANALNFGGAFNQKLGLMNQAVGGATGAANASTAAINPTAVGLSQPNMSTQTNFGTTGMNFASPATQMPNTQSALNFGQSVLGGQTSLSQTGVQAGTQTGIANSNPTWVGAVGSACCFIFLESYHGTMPSWVRLCRDYYYNREPSVARGYVKMAKWLVPLMKRYAVIRSLVWHLMVKPITQYGGWLCSVEGYSKYKNREWIKNIWFYMWKRLGGQNDK
jgi:hypothetical protein